MWRQSIWCFGIFPVRYEENIDNLCLPAIWCCPSRIIHVLVFVSTLHSFWRGCRTGHFNESLVPFILGVFLMVGKYCISVICIEIFWLYLDISYDPLCGNNLHNSQSDNFFCSTSAYTYFFGYRGRVAVFWYWCRVANSFRSFKRRNGNSRINDCLL